MSSLSELRDIERQRIADERTAIERERAAQIEAKRAAEQAVRDAEERKLREEREAVMRIEQARLDAEREARMRVEAAEGAERARLQLALDQQRMQEELELRRAEIAKKRPRWMMAVTGMALVATIALSIYAVDRAQQRDEADRAKQVAIDKQNAAQKEAEEVRNEFEKLVAEMDTLNAQVTQAEDALRKAQSEADRKRAEELLAQSRRAQAEAQRRKDELAHKLWKKKRNEKFIVSEECKRNPLANGCLPDSDK